MPSLSRGEGKYEKQEEREWGRRKRQSDMFIKN